MKGLGALNIRDVKHLCLLLGTSRRELDRICGAIEKYYWHGSVTVKGKIRPTATPKGRLREILNTLHDLLQRVILPDTIHGGRRGYSNVTHASAHTGKRVVIGLDLKDFFPSVTSGRIYRLFTKQLGCAPDVGRYLTRLTTLNGRLPQGSPTSTILAALTTESMARRIGRLATIHGADYGQYVDDTTLSGPSHITAMIPVVERIARQEGFEVNPSKTKIMHAGEEQVVTGVRVNRGIDAPKDKIREVRSLIERLGTRRRSGEQIQNGELASIKGKLHYITRLNRGAGRSLRRRLERAMNDAEPPPGTSR